MQKTLLIAMLALFTLSAITACDETIESSNSDEEAKQYTETLMQRADDVVGMPSISNFQERQWAKDIFELRDQADLPTYAYLFNQYTGDLVFLGNCIGYGLPYSVQYTNPEKVSLYDGGEYGAVSPITTKQPDPNGLFMPEGLSATWLLMVDPESGDVKPVYIEQEVIVSPIKLH